MRAREVFRFSIIGALITWDDDFSLDGRLMRRGAKFGRNEDDDDDVVVVPPHSKLNLFWPKEMGRKGVGTLGWGGKPSSSATV